MHGWWELFEDPRSTLEHRNSPDIIYLMTASLPLDIETADYMAAEAMRRALLAHPECHFILVEETARALFKAGHITMPVAVHVILFSERFHMTDHPKMVEATWHREAAAIPSPTVTSAHPFATRERSES